MRSAYDKGCQGGYTGPSGHKLALEGGGMTGVVWWGDSVGL